MLVKCGGTIGLVDLFTSSLAMLDQLIHTRQMMVLTSQGRPKAVPIILLY
jgi:hypothetical protein